MSIDLDEWINDPFAKLDKPRDASPPIASVSDFSEYDDHGDGRERLLSRTIANIHAVAKHLLNLDEVSAEELLVGVQPLGNTWCVEVRYGGFLLAIKEPSLGAALERTLAKLTAKVCNRLDNDTRLIAAIRARDGDREGTRLAIETAVRRVEGVHSVELREPENEPGIIDVDVTLPMLTLEVRDQTMAEVGKALSESMAAIVRFRVHVHGFIKQ